MQDLARDALVTSLQQVRFRYANSVDARGVDWELRVDDAHIARDAAISLIGANMAGKSTLIRVLTGALPINCVNFPTGHILVDGQSSALPISAPWARKRRIVAVHQNDPMFPTLTIWENILIASPYCFTRRTSLARAREELSQTIRMLDPSFTVTTDSLLSNLSGGGLAVIRLLRAVIWGFRLLLLDEPTSNLDSTNRELCFGVLDNHYPSGSAILLVSHNHSDHELLHLLADRRGVAYSTWHIENTGRVRAT